MAFNPLDWFRPSVAGTPAEPRKQFVAGLVVWVLAWLVVWWSRDLDETGSSTKTLVPGVSWLGVLVGLSLFWGGGLLVFRSVTAWGYFLSLVRRCKTVERLAFIAAGTLTLSAMLLHWVESRNLHWLLAAIAALFVLASAFGWKWPGKKQP